MAQNRNFDKLGIYIHIPFCERKCSYCDFYSIENQEHKKDYLTALSEEIQIVADMIGNDSCTDTVYFGGGTPSLLSPLEVEAILDRLTVKFKIDKDAEITLECNPGTITTEKLKNYKHLGINRISLGIQTFSDSELKFLSRIHTAQEARAALLSATEAGFENINIDLMYALPDQTLQQIETNLFETISFNPKHISAYALIFEPGTPLHNSLNNGNVRAIDSTIESEMYEFIINVLEDHGYHHYEVSNYCQPGYECRHNLKYWRGMEYIGFGASAHSYFNKTRSWNVSSVSSYVSALKKSELPTSASEVLSEEELIEEFIMLSLRCGQLDLEKLATKFNTFIDPEFIGELVNSGYAKNSNGTLRLTGKGFTVCDEIIEDVISHHMTACPPNSVFENFQAPNGNPLTAEQRNL